MEMRWPNIARIANAVHCISLIRGMVVRGGLDGIRAKGGRLLLQNKIARRGEWRMDN